MSSSALCDITFYSPVKVNRRFGGIYVLCFMLAYCVDYSSTLKMEAVCSSETSVDFHRSLFTLKRKRNYQQEGENLALR
jgi:hypothetical protein